MLWWKQFGAGLWAAHAGVFLLPATILAGAANLFFKLIDLPVYVVALVKSALTQRQAAAEPAVAGSAATEPAAAPAEAVELDLPTEPRILVDAEAAAVDLEDLVEALPEEELEMLPPQVQTTQAQVPRWRWGAS